MKVRDITVEARIAEAPKFRIYLGKTDIGEQVILKVAKTFEDGDILTKEASKFNILRSFESELSSLQEIQSLPNAHFDWLFANLISSFMESTQGDRRINVFKIPDVDLAKLTPLTKVHTGTEIDARSSVWILGRFLKFYMMFELMTVAEKGSAPKYPLFSPGDYFIGPENHRLVYYNFSDDIEDVVAYDFVKAIAKFILSWVAIEKDDPAQKEYQELLEDFANEGRRTFEEAHSDLYGLVERLWGIQYHPFTYRDRNTITWKTIKE